MPNEWTALLGQLDFWRGVGRLLVDLALVLAMYFIVMSISGHPVGLRRTTLRDRPKGSPAAAEDQKDANAHETKAHVTSDPRRLAHLDLLANLRHSLELQGATVVLIVFAVVLLAFNRILGGSEVATILAGITGYVLGSRSQAGATTPIGGASVEDGNLPGEEKKK
jgi:small-conductance mechanosensitive channel